MNGSPLLAVEDLTVHYNTRAGVVRAVDGVSLVVERGQVLGLVGEVRLRKVVTSPGPS